MMSRGADVVLGLALMTVGFAISTYLLVAHYAHVPLACVNSGPIDCDAVTNSSFGLVPGTTLPVALLGMVFFALNSAVYLLAVIRPSPRVIVAHLGIATCGVFVAVYLVWAEIVVINRICEWCTAVHILVLVNFLIALRRAQTLL
jgi:uncharacterized membrane protein